MLTMPSLALRVAWTSAEDVILSECYGRQAYRKISERLQRRTRNSIKCRARKLGLLGHKSAVMAQAKKHYTIQQDYFHLPTMENSYWAGFIAADGCISPKRNSVKVQLHSQDIAHLQWFASCAGYNGLIRRATGGAYKPESTCAILNICGVPHWVNDLAAAFNVTAHKSLTLEPPVGLNHDNGLAYIIGYIDGDGSISETRGHYKQAVYFSKAISVRGTIAVLIWIKQVFDASFSSSRSDPGVHVYQGHAQYRVAGRRAEQIIAALKQLDTPKLARKWS